MILRVRMASKGLNRMRLMSKMAFGIMVNGTGHGQLRLAHNTGHPDGFSYQKYLWGANGPISVLSSSYMHQYKCNRRRKVSELIIS